MVSRKAEIEAAFWPHVARGDGCWEWTAGRSGTGYGALSIRLPGGTPGKLRWLQLKPHRVSWELHNGPIPDGLLVCHRCDNPPCVRPDHLFLGTHADNMRDMAMKKRAGGFRPGKAHPRAKMSDEIVRAVRYLVAFGHSHHTVAECFGVTRPAVSQVIRRSNWKHVA